ncbi:hypothetical protein Riv7116_3750 [Rivularia sp. PCC 7116]|uniref:hypothetical protein n=1 Tax=Rivularia sp. PCC 7116 TaxID=373994 RepID=UPI00029F2301|nr:hypothetical protein [Rivularia sp. PCC 7116]AFY56195.1 hypothetical protein Riv7116_3750 [Rivularia sp. PCC 7116]
MKVVKRTVSLLVLSDLKDVRNRRKFSFRLLVINLFFMAGFLWFLSSSSNLTIKLFLLGFTLLLLIPGILLIRFDTSESNYFKINLKSNKIIHERRELFKNHIYRNKYSLKNVVLIGIKRINLNSDDAKNYRVRLYFKSKRYIDIGYFATPEKSFAIAKAISKFLKIPLKY